MTAVPRPPPPPMSNGQPPPPPPPFPGNFIFKLYGFGFVVLYFVL